MQRRGIALLLIGCAVTPVTPAHADTPSDAATATVPAAKVAEWLDAQIAEGRDLPLDDLRDVAVRFARERHTLVPPAEVERLRKEIEGHPDHPMSWAVESYDRMLKEGPSLSEVTARVRGWEEFRLNQDGVSASLAWHDTVVTPTHAYQLNPDQIALIDPRVGYPPGRQLNSVSHEFWNPINFLLYGDLGTRAGQEIERGAVRMDGERWSCDVRKPGETTRYEGRWVADWDRAVVERATTIENPDEPKYVGWFKVFLDWRMEPTLGRPVAARAELRFPDGSIAYAHIFRGAEREDPGVFDRVTAIPDIAGADPIRGPITATSMWDFREGSERFIKDPLGTREVIDQGRFEGTALTRGSTSLRWLGWMLLGALLVCFVGLRLWRHATQ